MIHVADNYYLDSDRYCFILYEEVETKKGKNEGSKQMVPVSYHGTTAQVVDKIMDIAFKQAISKDIVGCVRLIEGAKEKFNELLKLKKHG